MSSLQISWILYGITVVGGLISGYIYINIGIPIGASAFVGLFAGYFWEKHRMEFRYGEPYFFRLHRLDIWGAVRGAFFSAVAFQLASMI